MNKPKLREGAKETIKKAAREFGKAEGRDLGFVYGLGILWAIENLHKLLEPRDQPRVNGKRVAIVEVSE